MQTHSSEEKMIADLRQFVSDAEQLVRATKAETGAKVERLRGRVREIDGRVRENAWTALGIAAGAGLLVGLLFRPPMSHIERGHRALKL